MEMKHIEANITFLLNRTCINDIFLCTLASGCIQDMFRYIPDDFYLLSSSICILPIF